MTYIPHAALGAVKVLNGSVSSAKVVLSEAKKGVKYQMQCDVQIFGIPGSRTLKNVRYFGPLTYAVGSESRTSPPGFYDDLIAWALKKDEKLADIMKKLTGQLEGIAVTAQNLGGRWLIR